MNETADIIRANAIIAELSEQRTINGNRAAEWASRAAVLKVENDALRKRLSELEPKPDAPQRTTAASDRNKNARS